MTVLNYLAIATWICAAISLWTGRITIRSYFALMVLNAALFLADGLWHGDMPETAISVLGCAIFACLWRRDGHPRGRAAAGRRRRTPDPDH